MTEEKDLNVGLLNVDVAQQESADKEQETHTENIRNVENTPLNGQNQFQNKADLELQKLIADKDKVNLEIEKIKADKRKTDLEIDDLERGFFRRTNAPALISAMAAVLGLILASYAAWLGIQKLQLQDSEGKEKVAKEEARQAKNEKEAFEKQKDELERDLLGLRYSTETLAQLFSNSKDKYETDKKGLIEQKEALNNSNLEKQKAIEAKEKEIEKVAIQLKEVDGQLATAFKQRKVDQVQLEELKTERKKLEEQIEPLKAQKAKLEKDVETAWFESALTIMFEDTYTDKGILANKSYENLKKIYERGDKALQTQYNKILKDKLNIQRLSFYYKALVLCVLYEVNKTSVEKEWAKRNIYEFFDEWLIYNDLDGKPVVGSSLIPVFLKKLNENDSDRLFSIFIKKEIYDETKVLEIYDFLTKPENQRNVIYFKWNFYRADREIFFKIIEQAKKYALNATDSKKRDIALQVLRYFAPTAYISVLGYLIVNNVTLPAYEANRLVDLQAGKRPNIIIDKLETPLELSSNKWREWIKKHQKLYDLWLNNLNELKINEPLLASIMESGNY